MTHGLSRYIATVETAKHRLFMFMPFPFPAADVAAKERVRGLAEALDAHRKRAQEAHGIGLTAMYNVLEKLRAAKGASRNGFVWQLASRTLSEMR